MLQQQCRVQYHQELVLICKLLLPIDPLDLPTTVVGKVDRRLCEELAEMETAQISSPNDAYRELRMVVTGVAMLDFYLILQCHCTHMTCALAACYLVPPLCYTTRRN